MRALGCQCGDMGLRLASGSAFSHSAAYAELDASAAFSLDDMVLAVGDEGGLGGHCCTFRILHPNSFKLSVPLEPRAAKSPRLATSYSCLLLFAESSCSPLRVTRMAPEGRFSHP